MYSYDRHVAELKHSPQLPKAIEELNAFWQDEQKRRLQFYNDINEDSKAEFIDGEVVMHSPAKDAHNEVMALVARLFGGYVDVQSLGIVRVGKALISLARNDYEPDVAFWGPVKATIVNSNTHKYPAPDWVCEVLSPGSIRYDRVVKMADYAANGIPEYWIVDAELKVVEIYLLEASGQYALSLKSNSGVLKCTAINGLEFPIEAIFEPGVNVRTQFALYKQILE